jgi:hypothetical protein
VNGFSRRNGRLESDGQAADVSCSSGTTRGLTWSSVGPSSTPDAPDNISIIGCDATNGTYFQLYSDERGVCRVYEMTIGNGEWKFWRDGEPFSQRFTGTFSDNGKTITGRSEIAEDGTNFTTDFELLLRRVSEQAAKTTR